MYYPNLLAFITSKESEYESLVRDVQTLYDAIHSIQIQIQSQFNENLDIESW